MHYLLLSRCGSAIGETARDLAYRLFQTCERKSWAELARAFNSLVVSWPEIKNESKLLFKFNQFKKKNFVCVLAALFTALQPVLMSNLTSSAPSLRLYDLYKLLFLAKISRSK